MLVTVLNTRHVRLERDVTRRYLRLTRTAEPYDSVAQAVEMYTKLNAELDRLGRSDYGFLVDSRLAPLRNDVTFEAAIRLPRKQSVVGFARAAVLVLSAVGATQMSRVVRTDGVDMLVTLDEAAALEHVVTRHGKRPRRVSRPAG